MNKFLITNYDYLNLWYDSKDEKEMLDKYHELKLSYKDNVKLLSKTHLGDYSIITYYDDEVYMNWYKSNRDKLVDWLDIKENGKFQMCHRDIISNAINIGTNDDGLVMYREESKHFDLCITCDKLVLPLED